MSWHDKSIPELLETFKTDAQSGLTDSQVELSRENYGTNEIPITKQRSKFLLLLDQFNDPVIYILIVAAILNSFVADPKDAIVIAVVVILNTLIGFFQEIKAAGALKALMELSAPEARVIRNGIQKIIKTKEVVIGDIIILESGVRVPSDARLISTKNLQIDESMLTGESFSIVKDHTRIAEPDSALGDKLNMVYSGTIVQKGRGKAVVTSIGNQTEFGKISQRVGEAENIQSPLQLNIEKFSKKLSIAILASVIAIFIIGFIRGNDVVTMLLTSVGLAVSAIPEGLPVAVTITLSIGLNQMAKRKGIVKKLAAVETLGSTNIICTDKTGTLTKNQMTVTKMNIAESEYTSLGSGYAIEGKILKESDNTEIRFDYDNNIKLAALVSALCTESTITENGSNWKVTGDPTEAAMMIVARKLGFDESLWESNVGIPFESENQFMAVDVKHGDERYLTVKGSGVSVIERSKYMLDPEGNIVEIDRNIISRQIIKYSDNGLRVIAMAYKDFDGKDRYEVEDISDLIFIGLVGIEDAVREEAVEAVNNCYSAGVKVVMITGDHIRTASAIAKSVGIGKDKEKIIAILGREIDSMTDEELFEKVPNIDVYARVAPEHKFRIVKQLQKHDKVIAMTGDGVNDAPALKQADIGVAMGSGSDVAKEASHMVLMDDNFATIVKAIRRGRIILSNLKHILLYILSTSFGGLLTIASSVLVGYPLPILPAQLLWINLVTDGTSTFPLAFEKEHGDVMRQKPRKKDAPLVPREFVFRIAFAGFLMMLGTIAIFHFSAEDIFNPSLDELARSRTLAFSTLAFFQIWNVQNSRSYDRSLFFNLPYNKTDKLDRISPFRNPTLLLVMLLAIALQVSAVEIPIMNTLLNTVPLSMDDWLNVMTYSFSIIIFVEIAKYINALLKMKKN